MNARVALPAARCLSHGVARVGLFRHAACPAPRPVRRLATSARVPGRASQPPPATATKGAAQAQTPLDGYGTPVAVYRGAMFPALKKLKFFSLASLVTATVLSPFLMTLPAEISTFGRGSMIFVSLGASIASTGVIALFAKPYVGEMRLYKPTKAAAAAGKGPLIQMDTMDLLLRPYTTTVYDPTWLGPGQAKAFATWALAKTADHEPPLTDHELKPIRGKPADFAEDERLVAETVNTRNGKVKGRAWGSPIPALNIWTLRQEGKPLWHYQVHDHSLGEEWQIL